MFSIDDFEKLQFLTGRWKGQSADGKAFYEEYVRPTTTMLRSHRATSPDFADRTDGSLIALENSEIVSTWGELSWRATEIGPDFATFEPITAPSWFSWHRIDDNTLEARQRLSADSKEAEHTIRLTRMPG
jgi:hypothetical protein